MKNVLQMGSVVDGDGRDASVGRPWVGDAELSCDHLSHLQKLNPVNSETSGLFYLLLVRAMSNESSHTFCCYHHGERCVMHVDSDALHVSGVGSKAGVDVHHVPNPKEQSAYPVRTSPIHAV